VVVQEQALQQTIVDIGRALGDPAMGGWGLEGWIEALSKTRARLADHWAHHPSAWVRQLWFSARWGTAMAGSGVTGMGAHHPLSRGPPARGCRTGSVVTLNDGKKRSRSTTSTSAAR
jgi:hypothetical protein